VDSAMEGRAFVELAQQLAKAPEEFFQKLVNTVLSLSNANSAGISLLDVEEERFVWPAVAGGLRPYLGGGTPSNFGPCGTVLERNAPILFLRPQRHFLYLAPIRPVLEEVLLIPFYMNGRAVGTLWAVIHEAGSHFDTEDKRLLESLSKFAATAFKTLSMAGAIKPLLGRKFPS